MNVHILRKDGRKTLCGLDKYRWRKVADLHLAERMCVERGFDGVAVERVEHAPTDSPDRATCKVCLAGGPKIHLSTTSGESYRNLSYQVTACGSVVPKTKVRRDPTVVTCVRCSKTGEFRSLNERKAK